VHLDIGGAGDAAILQYLASLGEAIDMTSSASASISKNGRLRFPAPPEGVWLWLTPPPFAAGQGLQLIGVRPPPMDISRRIKIIHFCHVCSQVSAVPERLVELGYKALDSEGQTGLTSLAEVYACLRALAITEISDSKAALRLADKVINEMQRQATHDPYGRTYIHILWRPCFAVVQRSRFFVNFRQKRPKTMMH
jgi:hypothetical protein